MKFVFFVVPWHEKPSPMGHYNVPKNSDESDRFFPSVWREVVSTHTFSSIFAFFWLVGWIVTFWVGLRDNGGIVLIRWEGADR